jgi:hypothetical protein
MDKRPVVRCHGCEEKPIFGVTKDLRGQRFDRLTVAHSAGSSKESKCVMWHCVCDCGNNVHVLSVNLNAGKTGSCGCYRSEWASRKKPGFKPHTTLSEGQAAFNAVLRHYKSSASSKNREFTLSEDQFRSLILGDCHYCGALPSALVKGHRFNGDLIVNGIDRLDSDRGYVLDNVVSCCSRCNLGKRDLTKRDFLSWIERVHQFQTHISSVLRNDNSEACSG